MVPISIQECQCLVEILMDNGEAGRVGNIAGNVKSVRLD